MEKPGFSPSSRPSRSVTLPSGRPGQLIRDRRRSVGDAELALRDHLEPRPLEVEGLRNTAPAVGQRRRALIEVVLRPYEGTVRIVRRDRAEVEQSPDAALPIPHLAEIN